MDVPALAGRASVLSHQDLDVFLWLPGAPFLMPQFASTLDSRHTYHLGHGIGGLGVKEIDLPDDPQFTIIHYNQVSLRSNITVF